MRRIGYFILFITVFSCTSGPSQPNESLRTLNYPDVNLPFKPNVLWIVAEDLGPYLPSWGDSTIETPHISRLVKEGVKYTHVFSPSGVCAPSRAAISTGMYPTHIGANHMRTGGNPKFFPSGIIPYEAVLPVGVRMHSEELRRAGYYCTNNSKEDYQFKKAVTAWDESSGKAHWRNRPKGKPFFSIFNLGVTHESRIWAKAEDSLWVPQDHPVPVPPYLPDNEVGMTDVRRMYSNIKEMDAQVGNILAELEADGLLDSTIIFWYADHGGPLPRQKRLCYDSGLRVPMVVRFPDMQYAGTVDERLISFIDFSPTLMSLVGIEPPKILDGQAFLGEFNAEARKYIHAAGDRFDGKYDMIRGVRNDRFKYLRNYRVKQPYYLPVAYREQMPIMQELLKMNKQGTLNKYQAQWFRPTKDPEELFDCEADPHELNNLADDPEYQDVLAELRTECDRWMEEISDKGLLPEDSLIELLWPGSVQPVSQIPQIEKTDQGYVLSSATEGASIGYQFLAPEEEPSKTWEVYIEPVKIPNGKILHAIAHRVGYKPSEVVEVER
ncbi:MAG: sulfatase-like hydrolase/transferase [Bacteroidota bacterium]